jgi:hypothetical protein
MVRWDRCTGWSKWIPLDTSRCRLLWCRAVLERRQIVELVDAGLTTDRRGQSMRSRQQIIGGNKPRWKVHVTALVRKESGFPRIERNLRRSNLYAHVCPLSRVESRGLHDVKEATKGKNVVMIHKRTSNAGVARDEGSRRAADNRSSTVTYIHNSHNQSNNAYSTTYKHCSIDERGNGIQQPHHTPHKHTILFHVEMVLFVI